MKQGEIWMVDFDPSTGHEFQKQRPTIIIKSFIIFSIRYNILR